MFDKGQKQSSTLSCDSSYLDMMENVSVALEVPLSVYLLTMLMYQVDTLHVARYWSEVLRSTIMTHPG